MDFSTLEQAVERAARFRTPNGHELKTGLWVDRIGRAWESAAESPPGLRILGLHGFVAVEEGRGKMLSRRWQEVSVGPGDVLVILPEDAAAYWATGNGWRQRWVVWGGPVAAELERWTALASLGPAVRGAAEAVAAAYVQLRDRMPDESPEAAIERDAVLRLLIARVLTTARRGGLTAPQSDAVERVVDWIEREFHRPLAASELARCAGLSETHFRRLFTERMGVSPQAYLSARRIARAKELLAEGLLVRQVAEACGFHDEFYFMRVFKRRTGVTPGAWRSGSCPSVTDRHRDAAPGPRRNGFPRSGG